MWLSGENREKIFGGEREASRGQMRCAQMRTAFEVVGEVGIGLDRRAAPMSNEAHRVLSFPNADH